MASVTEYLLQLQKLTQTNLDILQTLTDAFYTKQNHLNTNIDDAKFIVPSFIALENKINMLEENFNNLVNAPTTGEAYFNIDGNSRSIEVRKYNTTPNSLTLNVTDTFIVDDNNINLLKDLLTPSPKIRFNIPDVPNDIVYVNVKRIFVKSDKLNEALSELTVKKNDQGVVEEVPSIQYKYSDMYKLLNSYKKGEDYEEHEQLMRLPIRKNVGSSTYVIDEILNDFVDDNLDNYITVRIKTNLSDPQYNNNMTYKLFDETIERRLSVGDYLTNYDGTAKVQVSEIKSTNNVLTFKVLNGEYLNLVGVSSYDYSKSINENSILKFYSPIDFDDDKYIDVTVNDSHHIYIAIAPVNDRMNIQSPWGSGLLVDTTRLKKDGETLKEYYDANVKNLGEIISNL